MKKVLTAIVLTAALSAPVYAGSGHEQRNKKSTSQVQIEDHVEMMQKLMADIKSEKDPAKKHQMMQKHMKSMRKGMHMIDNGVNPSVKMYTRIGLLEERTNMMQEMMLQMMDYSAEAEAEDRAFEETITEGGSGR